MIVAADATRPSGRGTIPTRHLPKDDRLTISQVPSLVKRALAPAALTLTLAACAPSPPPPPPGSLLPATTTTAEVPVTQAPVTSPPTTLPPEVPVSVPGGEVIEP